MWPTPIDPDGYIFAEILLREQPGRSGPALFETFLALFGCRDCPRGTHQIEGLGFDLQDEIVATLLLTKDRQHFVVESRRTNSVGND